MSSQSFKLMLLKRTLPSTLSSPCTTGSSLQRHQCIGRVSNRYSYSRSLSSCCNYSISSCEISGFSFPFVDNNSKFQRQQQYPFQQLRQYSYNSDNYHDTNNNNRSDQNEIRNTNTTNTSQNTNSTNTNNNTKLLNLPMYKKIGTVVRFDNHLGYGYIKPDDFNETGNENIDIFFHYTKVQTLTEGGGYVTMNRGQRVEYDSFYNEKGYTAIYVKALEGSSSLSPSDFIMKKKQKNILKQQRMEQQQQLQQQGQENNQNTDTYIDEFQQERWTTYGKVITILPGNVQYGYIRPMPMNDTITKTSSRSTKDVYFHFTNIITSTNVENGFRTLKEGDYVRYDAFYNNRGPTASKVYEVTEDDYNKYKNNITTVKTPSSNTSDSASNNTNNNNYGTVVYVREEQGSYGYLRPDNGTPDVFFHLSRIKPIEGSNDTTPTTFVGQRVQYESIMNSRGPTATTVTLLNDK